MNKRIVYQGTSGNILSNTRTEDVARFFGLNMLRGRIVSIKKDRIIIDIDGRSSTLENHYCTRKFREGENINLLFRHDDIIITSCNNELNVLKCVVVDYKTTKCNVKLFLKISNEVTY